MVVILTVLTSAPCATQCCVKNAAFQVSRLGAPQVFMLDMKHQNVVAKLPCLSEIHDLLL